MTREEFIDKWLVGYESREQKEEFVIEMMADLASLQSKGKTKSAEEFLRNKSYPSGVSDAGWEDFKHREKGVLFVPFVIKVMEEYAQSHANQDGWVSCAERLPEAEEEVLVLDSKFGKTDHNSSICVGYIAEETGTWSVYCETGIIDNYERDNCNYQYITHWMPLPKPPQP